MNRDGLKYLVAGSLLTIFFGWVFKTIDGSPVLASDVRGVSAGARDNAPGSVDKSIVARQFKLVDDKGDVAAILGTQPNGAPYLKMLGDKGKSYLEIESGQINIIDSGTNAITIGADDGERRIYVSYGKNESAFLLHADKNSSCTMGLSGKLGTNISFSCDSDGAALAGMSAKKHDGGITLAIDPSGSPLIGLSRGPKKGALSLYCHEKSTGMTVDLPDERAQAVIGLPCEDSDDASGPLFRTLDGSKKTVWKAP